MTSSVHSFSQPLCNPVAANRCHQYIDRKSGTVQTERLFKDRFVNFLYSQIRENAGFCFNQIISGRSTTLLSYLNFDLSFHHSRKKAQQFINDLGIDMGECIIPMERFFTARQVFERQIRYWECRPMPGDVTSSHLPYDTVSHQDHLVDRPFRSNDCAPPMDNGMVVSPSDSKMLVGNLTPHTALFIKDKFFTYQELLEKDAWLHIFEGGDFAIFRLTPDEYHYNHTPVSGEVLDIYEISGTFHACNPGAVIREVTPYSKNGRVVTVMDTDVPDGSGVGRVAMVEVTAMMIGIIEQCYSAHFYDCPTDLKPGMFLKKGQPKSLFRPGSSTVILLFEPERVAFSKDIVDNMHRVDGHSRFTEWFKKPLLETAVRVREAIADPKSSNKII